MVKHIGEICNYFLGYKTNASAEALNQNLQRFISINYGTRNSDFFLYRIAVHFSSFFFVGGFLPQHLKIVISR